MGTENGNQNTSRPSATFNRPLRIERFEAIRDAEMARGPEKMNVKLVDACNRIIVGNLEVGEEQKERAWQRLTERIREEEAAIAARLKRRPYSRARRPAWVYVLVALLVLLLAGSVCLASGLLPWVVNVSWDDDRLQIEFSKRTAEENYVEIEPKAEYSEVLGEKFIELLREMDIYVALPSYLPEGYSLKHTDILNEAWQEATADYSDGEHRLSIVVYKFSGKTEIQANMEKDAVLLEQHIYDGVEYIIYENLGRLCVQWGGLFYSVVIDCELPRDELIKIIKSIS